MSEKKSRSKPSGGWVDGIWRPNMVATNSCLSDDEFLKLVHTNLRRFEIIENMPLLCNKLGIVSPSFSKTTRAALSKYLFRFFEYERVEGSYSMVITKIFDQPKFPELEKKDSYNQYLLPVLASIVVGMQGEAEYDDRTLVTIHGTPMEWYISLGLCNTDLYNKNLPADLDQLLDIDSNRIDKYILINNAIATRREKNRDILRNLLTFLHKTKVVTWEENYEVTLDAGDDTEIKVLADADAKAYIRDSLYSVSNSMQYASIRSCILRGEYLSLMNAAKDKLNAMQETNTQLYNFPIKSFKKVHVLRVVPKSFKQFLLTDCKDYIAAQEKLNNKLMDAIYERDLEIVKRAVSEFSSYLPEQVDKDRFPLAIHWAIENSYRYLVPRDLAERNREINIKLNKVG